MSEKINLFTHNGLFHADDVFATAMLSLLSEDVNIVRGSEDEIPEDTSSWIIYDIGGGELDHHTIECKENNGTHPDTNIPYAACGLVWRKYYEQILDAIDCPQNYFDFVYERLEKSLILGIDAMDNGYDPVRESLKEVSYLTPDQEKMVIGNANIPFTITQMIKDFNPTWESNRDINEAFEDAVSFAKDILLNRLDSIIDALDGREFILQNIDFSSNHMMILDKFAPWQGVVTSQSHVNPKAKDLWYVISPAMRGGWNVQCVLDDPDNRTSYRHPFPTGWYGLRGEELQKESGVNTARFCHSSGFLLSADEQADAIKLAYIAMKQK